jgi:predicted DNA-binding transcriptional regulator AlpA
LSAQLGTEQVLSAREKQKVQFSQGLSGIYRVYIAESANLSSAPASNSKWQVKMASDIFNTIEAARYVRLSKSTLERMRVTGEGPKYCKLGGAVRYPEAYLKAWLESRLIRSTSETA